MKNQRPNFLRFTLPIIAILLPVFSLATTVYDVVVSPGLSEAISSLGRQAWVPFFLIAIVMLSLETLRYLRDNPEAEKKIKRRSNVKSPDADLPYFLTETHEFHEELHFRIRTEIEKLSNRSNINLVIGLAASSLAVLIVFVSLVIIPPPAGHSISEIIPRLALAAFSQIVGYFFLRLYKSNLDDIKYFHNELTNIDLIFTALTIALQGKNLKSIDPILLNLIKSERNFLLKKGEKTVTMGEIESFQSQLAGVTQLISGLLKGKANGV